MKHYVEYGKASSRLCVFTLLFMPLAAHATVQDDIGYTALSNLLGTSTPDGSGVQVTQVEAPVGSGSWSPDISNAQFTGKTITDLSVPTSPSSSGHATGVATRFYGNSTSIASGITSIDVFNANGWLFGEFLNVGTNAKPLSSSSRIANHSYIGQFGDSSVTSDALRRMDWLVERDEYIQVVGTNNSGTNQPIQ